MSLYAIGDFHLSFTVNKPMDVFDKRWKNHVVKIEKYWKKRVTENDTVVITGDHSWGEILQSVRRIWILYGSAGQEDSASGKSRYVLGCEENRKSE